VGEGEVHVDIMGNTWPYWFGGGMAPVEGPEGALKVTSNTYRRHVCQRQEHRSFFAAKIEKGSRGL
jgi:hypothetical protein